MSIESEFKKFVGIAERIAVALEGRGVDDVYDDVVFDDLKGGVEKEESVGMEEPEPEPFLEEPLIDVNQTMDDIAVDAITRTVKKKPVINEEVKPVNLTFDDVKEEARILVDNFPENRKGFEKAKKILKKLGADELDALVPEKFAEAVNAFRKAVKAWS